MSAVITRTKETMMTGRDFLRGRENIRATTRTLVPIR
jgi:hypothetical protein